MGPRRTMAKNGAGVVTGGSRTLAHDILNRLPLSISYNQAISGFTIGKTEFLSIRQRHCWIGPNPAIRSMSISQMGEKFSGQIRFFIRLSQKKHPPKNDGHFVRKRATPKVVWPGCGPVA